MVASFAQSPVSFKLVLVPEKGHSQTTERAQAELELAIRHLKQVEERVSLQREKIARMRADGYHPNPKNNGSGRFCGHLKI
jgi:hypothetical protein